MARDSERYINRSIISSALIATVRQIQADFPSLAAGIRRIVVYSPTALKRVYAAVLGRNAAALANAASEQANP